MKNNNSGNHLRIGELPDLRIVSTKRLLFHEDPDEERLLNLVSRLGTEGLLKNPPIVAEIERDGDLVILDGANRVTALTKLGFPHIPVQVVQIDDDLLTLQCWHHEVEKMGREFFLGKMTDWPNIRVIESHPELRNDNGEEAPSDAARRGEHGARGDSFLCSLTFDDGSAVAAHHAGDLVEQVDDLKKITGLYLQEPLSDRVSYTNLSHLKRNYPDFRTLIMFRTFTKGELLKIVFSGRKLPAGITRVILPKRALGLNIRLEILKSELTLEEKNHWLTEMIHKMVLNKSIRFYREPTFVFDE